VENEVGENGVLTALVATGASAQTNLGAQKPEASLPFVMTKVATFKLPWRLAFLPDGWMLITEKVGPIWLVTQTGEKRPVANVRPVLAQGQGGMLGIFLSPHYAEDHFVYLTYAEPGEGGSSLALARAKLLLGEGSASLDDLKVIWRDASAVGRTVWRSDRFFTGRQLPVPGGRRPAADDARPGSQSTPRQDPAPDSRREARTRQSDGGQGRHGYGACNRSTRRHRKGEDGPGDSDLFVPGSEHDAGRNLDQWPLHALWPGFRARRQVMGGGAWPKRW
jgi:hypothetical protein